MAEVLAYGLVRSKLLQAEDIVASHYRPERLTEFKELVPVRTTINNQEAYVQSDITVLCVRPQSMKAVLQEIAPFLSSERLLISIAAGLPISLYEAEIG